MDLMNDISNIVKIAVCAWGAWLAVQGAMIFSEGNGDNSTIKKTEGGGKMIGGAVIVILGWTVVPKIFTYLTSGF